MYVGLKQPRGDGERYVTPARAAAKETNPTRANGIIVLVNSQTGFCHRFLFPQFYKAKIF